MEIIVFMSLGILCMVFAVTLFNFITAPKILDAPALREAPKVSILIPARNEEHNIESCLKGLLAQDYPDYEIVILDDQSKDQTAQIVQKYVAQDSRVKLIQGRPLPQGWTGKNWACHQLSEIAAGDIFIFTDADNRHATFAASRTVSWMQKLGLGLISAFPQQWTVTLAEKLVVPIMDLFVYSALPLWLTYYASHHSLAAANGQWIAFTRTAYNKIGGHTAVRHHLVEDTELSRLAKKCGFKILTTSGADAVFCRMYHSVDEIWHGFSKNFYGLTGYNFVIFWGIIIALFIGFISPYFLWLYPDISIYAVIGIGINLLIRTMLSIKYHHPVAVSALLHPFGILIAIAIGINSFRSRKRGLIQWKGREIRFE